VIAKRTLGAFVRKRIEMSLQESVQRHLDEWYRRTLKASWRNSAELKAEFGSASIVTSERVVFNIKGNEFRLIAKVDYTFPTVRILWIGTHREYDQVDVRTVSFERSRYGIISDSQ
jgi:mRNA interferase HigB